MDRLRQIHSAIFTVVATGLSLIGVGAIARICVALGAIWLEDVGDDGPARKQMAHSGR